LITLSLNATPCSLVQEYQRFGEVCSVHPKRHMPEAYRISCFVGLSEYQDDVLKTGPGWLSLYSDSLRVGPFGDQIPVEARFSAPVQNGRGAHPASYTMGTGSTSGVKCPGRGVDHPSHLAPSLKKGHRSISTPPLGLHGVLYSEL